MTLLDIPIFGSLNLWCWGSFLLLQFFWNLSLELFFEKWSWVASPHNEVTSLLCGRQLLSSPTKVVNSIQPDLVTGGRWLPSSRIILPAVPCSSLLSNSPAFQTQKPELPLAPPCPLLTPKFRSNRTLPVALPRPVAASSTWPLARCTKETIFSSKPNTNLPEETAGGGDPGLPLRTN